MANLDFSTTPFADFAYTKIFGTPDTAAHFAKVFGDNASLQRALSALQRGPALFFRDNVIAFDEDPITLGAVKDGSFAGTVVQQPFEWAYQGSKLFAAFLSGDKSGVPANGILIIPGKILDKDNVDEFKADLEAKLKAAK